MAIINDKIYYYNMAQSKVVTDSVPIRTDNNYGYPSKNKSAFFNEYISLAIKCDTDSKIFKYFNTHNQFSFQPIISGNFLGTTKETYSIGVQQFNKTTGSDDYYYAEIQDSAENTIKISFINKDNDPYNWNGFYIFLKDIFIKINNDVSVRIDVTGGDVEAITESVSFDLPYFDLNYQIPDLENLTYKIKALENYSDLEDYLLQQEQLEINFSLPKKFLQTITSGGINVPKLDLNIYLQYGALSNTLISLCNYDDSSKTNFNNFPYIKFICDNSWNVSLGGQIVEQKTFLSNIAQTNFLILPLLYENIQNLDDSVENKKNKKNLINLNRLFFSITLYGTNGDYTTFGKYQFPESEDLEKLLEITNNKIITELNLQISTNEKKAFLNDQKLAFFNAGRIPRTITGYYRTPDLISQLTPAVVETTGTNPYTWFEIPSSWTPENCIGVVYRNYAENNTFFRAIQWGEDVVNNGVPLIREAAISFMYYSGDSVGGSTDGLKSYTITNTHKYRHVLKFKATQSNNNTIKYEIGIPNKINCNTTTIDTHSWPEHIYLLCV